MTYQRTKVQPASTQWNRPQVVVWEARLGPRLYRWAIVAGNGRDLARSETLYTRESDAYAAALRVIVLLRGDVVIERQAKPDRIEVLVPAVGQED